MSFDPSPLTTYLQSAKQTPLYALRTRKITTTITLVSDLNPSMRGDNVTFTATIADIAATGTVAFLDGTTPIGMGTLNSSGVATFSTSTLKWSSPFLPPHSITAVYAGDKLFNPCTSNPVAQVVNAGPIQMDSASVDVINGYATFMGTPATWTGFMPRIDRGSWGESVGSFGAGAEVSAFIGPPFRIVIFDSFGIDAIELDYDYSDVDWPIGTWTQTGHTPAGFSPTNPPGWDGPRTITISWV